MKNWFDVHAEEGAEEAEIRVFGEIGNYLDDWWGDAKERGITTAKTFVDALAALGEKVKTIRVRLNSPGGDVFTGITIANALRAEGGRGRKVIASIEGLAASSASVIAMGASEVHVAENAVVMVHAPWAGQVGNAKAMRSMADWLDTVRDALVKTYQWHSKKSEKDLLALIDGEDGQGTWMDADEAIAAGLATEKVAGLRAAASIDPKAAARLHVPERFAARVQALLAADPEPAKGEEPPAPEPESKPEDAPAPQAALDAPWSAVLNLCLKADLDLAFAASLMASGGGDLPTMQARIAAERERRAQAKARETEIRGFCAKTRMDDLADGYVAGGMTVEQVRDQLVRITAKVDEAAQTDSTLGPKHGTKPKAVIDITAIYARLNGLSKE